MPGTTAHARRSRLMLTWSVLVATLVLAVALAAKIGLADTTWPDVGQAFLHALGLGPARLEGGARIVAAIRLPRIFLAATAGAALAFAGGLQSGAFRSALAAPVTTGAAAGALFGAAVAIGILGGAGSAALGATPEVTHRLVRVALATIGAAGATYAALRLARVEGTIAVAPLLLAGLAVNALVGSLAAMALFLGPAGTQAAAALVVNWSFGGLLGLAEPGDWVVPLVGLGIAVVLAIPAVRALDLLLLGEEEAATSGVDVPRVRLLALGGAAIATGAAVALVGVVAFLGLLAPTLVRPWTGPAHARLLPGCTVLGATLLIIADALGRAVSGPLDLPAGVVTAALGAPVLMVLLTRGLREVSA